MLALARSLGPLIFASLAVACGSSDGEAGAGTGGSAAGGSAGVAGQGGGGSAGQAPCADDPMPGSSCVERVTGRVVDGAGNGIALLSTSVCGATCFYGETGADGAFDIQVGAHVVPSAFSVLPHGRPSRTSFYFPLAAPTEGVVAMNDLLALDLPASGPMLVVKTDGQGAPAQSVTSNGVTFDVAAGVHVVLDVEDLVLGDEGKQFRALAIASELRSRFANPTLGLVGLWALTPFEAELTSQTTGEPAFARLSVPNTAGLAAGAVVEFLALGSYLFPSWVPAASFEVVATGSVSADGARLEMDVGEGLPHLTWLGVRPKL